LDLSISLVNTRHEFLIFRRETGIDLNVDGSSFYPRFYNLPTSDSYVHWLLEIPLAPIEFSTETSIMELLAVSNNVEIDIGRMIKKNIYRLLLRERELRETRFLYEEICRL